MRIGNSSGLEDFMRNTRTTLRTRPMEWEKWGTYRRPVIGSILQHAAVVGRNHLAVADHVTCQFVDAGVLNLDELAVLLRLSNFNRIQLTSSDKPKLGTVWLAGSHASC